MGNIINTAPCRFCGQMVQIESEEKLTEPQAEEKATMSCTCEPLRNDPHISLSVTRICSLIPSISVSWSLYARH